ncbi:MAG: hypothetical protein ACREAC_28905, partial [Blastocatellia bacterium]
MKEALMSNAEHEMEIDAAPHNLASTISLDRFTVSLLRFTLRAVDPVELPQFSGSTFRGAFGTEFRRLVCLP